jgi:hypothetical protein
MSQRDSQSAVPISDSNKPCELVRHLAEENLKLPWPRAELVEEFLRESATAARFDSINVDALTSVATIRSLDSVSKSHVIGWTMLTYRWLAAKENGGRNETFISGRNAQQLCRFVLYLLIDFQKHYEPTSVEEAREALQFVRWAGFSLWLNPVTWLRKAQVTIAANGLTMEMAEELQNWLEKDLLGSAGAQDRQCRAIIKSILGKTERGHIEPIDDWGRAATRALAAMPPADATIWEEILNHAFTVSGYRPSNRWLKSAQKLIDASTKEWFIRNAADWLLLMRRATSVVMTVPHRLPEAVLTEINGNLLRGLVWCCGLCPTPAIVAALAETAEICLKKIPNCGARSMKVGNACIMTLGTLPNMQGVAALTRLRQKVKYATAQQLIDKTLVEAAARAGLSRDDLEEMSVPTFNLVNGSLTETLGSSTAEIGLTGSRGASLTWRNPSGKTQKSIPVAVKNEFGTELKQLKQTVKEIESTLSAQIGRLESLLMSERYWALEDWRKRYLEHPLLRHISRSIIWYFEAGSRRTLGAWEKDQIVDVSGKPLDWLDDSTHVRLWHPIGFAPETVLAWREWLWKREITQPFKQAHREVYLLTPAELETNTYSNRFAAHIVRQHQFAALCKQRGWRYTLQGAWDSFNTPRRELPAWNLAVEFWVEAVAPESAESTGNTGIYNHLSTDQVRFFRNGSAEPLPVSEVPAIVFTEVLRDVDLFVGVCSIGNDPTWRDGGQERFGEYWERFAFGDLSASAESRASVLRELVPRLKIADRCRFEKNFLVVRGDLRTYKIHMGSGNIMMEPNNQYLCIVPDRSAKSREERFTSFLPFEGDTTLSLILSKAMLLAADKRITDATILRQLG